MNLIITTHGYIKSNHSVAPGHFLLGIELPADFPRPSPGQFVMLRNLQDGQSLLSRPFSIYGFKSDGSHAVLELLCRVAGRETMRLSYLSTGAKVEVMGPLGVGFTLNAQTKKLILLAGGVGAAPLAFFLSELNIKMKLPQVDVLLGAKTADVAAAMGERFGSLSRLLFATDDGSLGYHGPVTDILEKELSYQNNEDIQILACGPTPMTRALVRVIGNRPIACQVSLEERMACGVGACLGCVVAAKDGEGKMIYKSVCKDGPVFDIRELMWQL